MKRLSNSDKGFTLIEVVIVLAIAAGLILVVLLAVGGAQRSARDSKRQSTAGQLAAALENYASNNGGAYPQGAGNPLSSGYLSNIVDPTTGAAPASSITAPTSSNMGMVYAGGYVCKPNNSGMQAGTARNWAILWWSETAGADNCKDNN